MTNGKIILTLVIGLLTMPTSAWGLTGTGTAEDPYIPISGAQMRSAVSSDISIIFIRLGNDISLGNDQTLEIGSGKTITIDLNGRNLYQTNSSQSYHCVIKNEGILTIKDNTGNNGAIYGGYNSTNGGKGGGLYNTSTGTLTIESGCIGNSSPSSNIASYGGGIYNEGSLTIKGGVIQNNRNGAICHNGTSFKMEGNLTITSTSGGGIYLADGKKIEITGTLTTTTPIGITMASLGIFTEGLNGNGSISNFTSDDPLIGVYADGTEAKLKTYWSWLQDEFTAGHNVTLDKDYTRHTTYDNNGLVVPSTATITLDLNGHTIDCKRQGNSTASGYVIKNNGTLTITDGGTGGIIKGGNNYCTNSDYGGGICNMGILTISGGSIQENSSASGGGIYNTGTLTIDDGAIKNNTCYSGSGGGIWNYGSGASVTINGGTIESNTTNSGGGGIENHQGSLNIIGGIIQSNVANGGWGGGICLESGTLIISGGTIQNNSSREGGGGICNRGTMTISNATINNNLSSYSDGGGIYNFGTFKMSGSPTIKDNKKNSTTNSNIYLYSGKIEILEGGLSNTDPIGITMLNRGVFTTGLDAHAGDYTKFTSDISNYVGVFDSSGEAKLQSYWDNLKDQFEAGGIITLSRNYESYQTDNDMLHIPSDKTVTLYLNGYNIDRKLTSATINGCVICNEGELIITGSGTIKGGNNTNTGEYKGNGIWHNGSRGTGLSMQDGPVTDIYLAHGKNITITGSLTNATAIGIASDDATCVFTTGLNTRGNSSNFSALQTEKAIGTNSDGNAIVGIAYNLTSYSCKVYDAIGNVKTKAVQGEALTITLSLSYVPISLSYTAGNNPAVPISNYPKNGNYAFTMPSLGCPVTITVTAFPGGYCGEGDDIEVMKYYIEDGTLKFITEDGNNKAMKNYAQGEVPWRNSGFSAVNLDHVTNITDYAFYNRSGLDKAVTIPTAVTSIGENAFWGCSNLPAIHVTEPNSNYDSEAGVLYNEGKTKLICYPGGKEEAGYNLPNTVTDITVGAFSHNTHLQEINVVSGGIPSFEAEDGVLFNSGKTTLVRYPAGKNDITAYTIPSSVTKIETYAFQDCKTTNGALTHIYVKHDLTSGGSINMFENSDFRIMVDADKRSDYINAACWSNYNSRIYAISLSGASISLANPSLDYTGSPLTQSSISVSIDGRTLDPSTEYEVSYENNVNVGTATVKIQGKGNYSSLTGATTFVIKRKIEFNVNTNYVTYYASEDLERPSKYESKIYDTSYSTFHDYKIFIISKIEGNVITLSEVDYFPANTAVLLYHDMSESFVNRTFHLSKVTGSSVSSSSKFNGYDEDKSYNVINPDNKPMYVLGNNQFVRVNGNSGTLPARRCCIVDPYTPETSPSPAPAFLYFSNNGDNTTGVAPLKERENTNELFSQDWYTIDGVKLDRMPTQKGIFINNGRKVIIK